jgi:hypothetical protein
MDRTDPITTPMILDHNESRKVSDFIGIFVQILQILALFTTLENILIDRGESIGVRDQLPEEDQRILKRLGIFLEQKRILPRKRLSAGYGFVFFVRFIDNRIHDHSPVIILKTELPYVRQAYPPRLKHYRRRVIDLLACLQNFRWMIYFSNKPKRT